MISSANLANVWNWALQTAVLLAVVGGLLAAMRVVDARVRLRVWRGALMSALALPLFQRWQIVFVTAGDTADAIADPVRWNWAPWLAVVIMFGVIIRAVWLISSFWGLRRLRMRAIAWLPPPAWYPPMAGTIGASAELGVSTEIGSAVTFGVRRPSILVPANLLESPEPHQRAVVAHELHHVARRDWLWVLGEEFIRTALWWHPAIWFALDEVQLAREEVVDRQAIAATGSRRSYLEALVAAADPAAYRTMGFVPNFYRRRHLSMRIKRLLQENTMTTRKVIGIAAALALALPATVVAAGAAFPLVAVDEAVRQDPPPPPPPPPPAPVRVKPTQDPAKVPPPPTPARPVRKSDMPPPPPPPPPPPAPVKMKPPAPPKVVSTSQGVPGAMPGKGVNDDVVKVGPPSPPKVVRKGDLPGPPPPPPPAPSAKVPAPPPPPPKGVSAVPGGNVKGTPPPPPTPAKVIKKGEMPLPPPPPPPVPVKKGRGGK